MSGFRASEQCRFLSIKGVDYWVQEVSGCQVMHVVAMITDDRLGGFPKSFLVVLMHFPA